MQLSPPAPTSAAATTSAAPNAIAPTPAVTFASVGSVIAEGQVRSSDGQIDADFYVTVKANNGLQLAVAVVSLTGDALSGFTANPPVPLTLELTEREPELGSCTGAGAQLALDLGPLSADHEQYFDLGAFNDVTHGDPTSFAGAQVTRHVSGAGEAGCNQTVISTGGLQWASVSGG